MICRGNDGRLVNEGLIKDAPATGTPAAKTANQRSTPAAPPPQAPAGKAAPAVTRPQSPPAQAQREAAQSNQPQARRVETIIEATIDDLPIDDTVQKIGAMQINGCSVFSKWRDGFSDEAWNRRQPEAELYAGSQFRVPAYMSDEKTRELFGVPYSEWSPSQRQAVADRAWSCHREATGLRQSLAGEVRQALNDTRNNRASSTVATHKASLLRIAESHLASTNVFIMWLSSWNNILDGRRYTLAQIEAAFDDLSKASLNPNLLGRIVAVSEPRSLAYLGGGFHNIRDFSPEEAKAFFERFVVWRDDAIFRALQPVANAVAAAPSTLAGLATVRTAVDANVVYTTLRRLAPENAVFAKIAADITALSEKVQDDAVKTFNATVASAPVTMAGAIEIEKAADEIKQARLHISDSEWAAAEDKHANIVRAILNQVATEVKNFEAESYRDVIKLKARADALATGTSIRRPMTAFDPTKFELQVSETEKVIRDKWTSIASKLLPEFTKDATALPNTDEGRRKLEAMGKPMLEVFGPVNGGYAKVIEAKSIAIDTAIKAELCRTTMGTIGISTSNGARLVPTLRGTVPMSQLICGLVDRGAIVSEFKAPNMVTGLFASEISFKLTEANQLPLRLIGKEADANGQKVVYMTRMVEEVSNRSIDLSTDRWREIVTIVAAPDDLPGAAELKRLRSMWEGFGPNRR